MASSQQHTSALISPQPDDAPAIVQRVRHGFAARHVQLLARTQISPNFLRLTVGGEALQGFVSTGFDDHVKLILPQAGQLKPNLPELVDGRPRFAGPRPITRDYTPLHFDAARNTLTLDFAMHGSGPADDWAMHAPIGQWLGLAGPRGSLVIEPQLDWHLLLGDETAMPAIERRLAELPASTRAVVRVQLRNPADQRDWQSAAQLDLQWVPSLAQAVAELPLPKGEGFVWAAGEAHAMAELRAQLLGQGVEAKRLRTPAYWKRGEAGFHEH